jgi:hypothetical protein
MRQRVSGRGWAYIGAVLGGAVSVAANVAHSYVPPVGVPGDWSPQKGAVVGAVFWPVALLVAVEIFGRVVWPEGRRWVALRYLGLLPVAAVAAIVSYRHMAGLLDWYGDDVIASTIGPLAVDGLMVMATGALVATSHTRREAGVGDNSHPDVDDQGDGMPTELALALAANTALGAALGVEPEVSNVGQLTPPKRRGKRPTVASKVARIAARKPDATTAEIAAKAGVSESTVRRHLAAITTPPESAVSATADEINNHEPALAGQNGAPS